MAASCTWELPPEGYKLLRRLSTPVVRHLHLHHPVMRAMVTVLTSSGLLVLLAVPSLGQQAFSSSPDYGSPSASVLTQSSFLPTTTQPSQSPIHIAGGVDFSKAVLTEDGRLCVIKESSVSTLSKDPILECKHKNVEKCHYTYVTFFKPAQEEKCEENFEKICQIVFKQEAAKERVRKCYRPLEKVCNGQGPEECRTVYESSCTTRYIEEGPGKFVGDTKCEKKPVEICGAGCLTQEGEEECHDKMKDTLVDVPEETCDLNPQKSCRLVTRLVPSLRPKLECTIVPQDNCNLRFSQPKKTAKPLRTEWCLDQRDQAGGQPTQNKPTFTKPSLDQPSYGQPTPDQPTYSQAASLDLRSNQRF